MTPSGAPIRRSPLADLHRRAGARFVAAGEWPETYGNVQRERDAVRDRAGLLDRGPFDRIQLTGPTLAPAPPGPAFALGMVTSGRIDGRPVDLWGLTQASSLLIAPAVDARSAGAVATSLETAGLEATDMSSLYATLELIGPRSRAVLEELFPVDVSPGALADRAIAFGPLASVNVTLARTDKRGVAAFTVLVERDQAEYLWDALLHIGERHGLSPVGAAAVAED